MSLNPLPLNVVNEVPEEFDLKESRMFSVLNGAQEFTARTYEAQSFSNTGFSITADPPSENDIIYPIFWKEVDFEFSATFTRSGTAVDVYPFNAAADLKEANGKKLIAPREFPLSKIIDSETVNMNGASFTTNLNEYSTAFLRICQDIFDRTGKLSLTPSMLDEVNTYALGTSTFRDPFAKYEDSIIRESRAAFGGNNYGGALTTSTATKKTFKFTVSEPCFVSPFMYQKKGMTGIKSLSYNAVVGDVWRAVCTNGPIKFADRTNDGTTVATADDATLTIKKARLKFYYASPKLLDRIPKQLSYAFQEVQTYSTEMEKVPAHGVFSEDSITANLPSINLSSVPRRLIIWAEERKADKAGKANTSKTDTLKAAIQSVSISFGTRSGVLSNATKQDLYYLSKKNGVNLTYTQWSAKTGGPLVLDFGRDIGLPTDVSPGLLSNPQLGIKMTFKNIFGEEKSFTAKYAVIYDGALNIINGNVSRNLGVLSQNDVLEAQMDGQEYISSEKCDNVFGGRIAGGFNPLAILPFLQPALQAVRKGVQIGAPIAKQVADVGEKIGLGKGGQGGRIAGGMRKGGRVLSRGDLKKGMYQQTDEM